MNEAIFAAAHLVCYLPEAEVMQCPQFDRYQGKSGPDADIEFRQILTHHDISRESFAVVHNIAPFSVGGVVVGCGGQS
jgi:hypothetical protein